jgi:phosphoribosylglycinamide formyltransferase-1
MRLGILASGRGSNMTAILDAVDQGKINVEVSLVLSNNPDSAAIQYAADAGIKTQVVDHRTFGKDREAFEEELDSALRAAKVECVVLAGFMRVLTPYFVSRWKGRLINIHPSLLPSFRGLHAQRQAVNAGVKVAGCTVHFVDEGTDTGPIIAQMAVPVYFDDTEDTLSARILVKEHELLPTVIGWIAQGRVKIEGSHVKVKRA